MLEALLKAAMLTQNLMRCGEGVLCRFPCRVLALKRTAPKTPKC